MPSVDWKDGHEVLLFVFECVGMLAFVIIMGLAALAPLLLPDERCRQKQPPATERKD